MDINEYLNGILSEQTLNYDSNELTDLRSTRDEVEGLLKSELESSNPVIRYGGSKAKGTMIKESYDLDITCYFLHGDESSGETLQDIFNNVKKILDKKYYVQAKTSALRLQSSEGKDFHIDVVPGRFVDEENEDTFLYFSEAEKNRLKTNLNKHIDHIKNSGQRDLIKLLKFWRYRYGLSVKTFILELLAIEVLGKSNKPLNERLLNFWEETKDNIDNITLKDPANPEGNDLSSIYNDSIKSQLSNTSQNTLETIENVGWEAVFGELESEDKESRITLIQASSKDVKEERTPAKPWIDNN